MQLFKDLPGITHIFDLGAGTAAASIAAWRCGISYEGICYNKAHKDWLDNVLDNCMYAVVAEGIATKVSKSDQEFQERVRHLFRPQVDEGMRLLQAQKAIPEEIESSSDDDDDDHQPKKEDGEDDDNDP